MAGWLQPTQLRGREGLQLGGSFCLKISVIEGDHEHSTSLRTDKPVQIECSVSQLFPCEVFHNRKGDQIVISEQLGVPIRVSPLVDFYFVPFELVGDSLS